MVLIPTVGDDRRRRPSCAPASGPPRTSRPPSTARPTAIGYLEPERRWRGRPTPRRARLGPPCPPGHSSSPTPRATGPASTTAAPTSRCTDLDLEDPIVEGRFGRCDGRLPIERRRGRPDHRRCWTTSTSGWGTRSRPERFGRSLLIVGAVEPLGYDEQSVFVDRPGHGTPRRQPGLPRLAAPHRSTSTRISGWGISPTKAIEIDYYVDCTDDEDAGVFWTYLGGGRRPAGPRHGHRRRLRRRRPPPAPHHRAAVGHRWLAPDGALVPPRPGLVGGALGAVVGVGLGVVADPADPRRWLESLTDRPVDSPVTRLGGRSSRSCSSAPLAAVGAAWLPARSAARVPTLQALAGRRPQPRSRGACRSSGRWRSPVAAPARGRRRQRRLGRDRDDPRGRRRQRRRPPRRPGRRPVGRRRPRAAQRPVARVRPTGRPQPGPLPPPVERGRRRHLRRRRDSHRRVDALPHLRRRADLQ